MFWTFHFITELFLKINHVSFHSFRFNSNYFACDSTKCQPPELRQKQIDENWIDFFSSHRPCVVRSARTTRCQTQTCHTLFARHRSYSSRIGIDCCIAKGRWFLLNSKNNSTFVSCHPRSLVRSDNLIVHALRRLLKYWKKIIAEIAQKTAHGACSKHTLHTYVLRPQYTRTTCSNIISIIRTSLVVLDRTTKTVLLSWKNGIQFNLLKCTNIRWVQKPFLLSFSFSSVMAQRVNESRKQTPFELPGLHAERNCKERKWEISLPNQYNHTFIIHIHSKKSYWTLVNILH